MPQHLISLVIAYSYIRFSHPSQSEGDSLRRQTAAAADWCERNGAALDKSTTLHDLGKSAYTGSHRTNPDRHALAAFLKLVESGKVPRGSYLIIENLDRLSREHIQPALLLVLNLLQAGIRIVQLSPAEMTFDDKSEGMQVMMMVMELSRGHGESAMKSERVGAAWAEKKSRARSGNDQPPRRKDGRVTRALTSRLPAWVEEKAGKMQLIPERAAVVKRIFALSAAGYGYVAIVRRLTAEKVPPFGESVVKPGRKRGAHSGRWTLPYVVRILTDRRAVGEYQPCGRGRKPEGAPIAGYFPAAVTEEEYWAARAMWGRGKHGRKGPRQGKYINLFAGLLRNARDGESYIASTKSTRVFIAYGHQEGRSPPWSFPINVLEDAVLSCLREIDPHEVLNGDHGPDESQVLAAQHASAEAAVAAIAAELDEHGESPTLYRRLREKEREQADLAARLADARQKAAHPLSETWGEAQTLVGVLASAADPADVRLRLRAAIRRIAESIWLLVVPRGRDRLCAVQIWFAGGKRCRSYLINYRAPGNHRPGGWTVRSIAETVKAGSLDLRKKKDVKALTAALEALDLEALAAVMGGK